VDPLCHCLGRHSGDILQTLSAHFAAHLLADGTQMAMAPTLFSIDQLPRSHVETFGKVQKLAQAAIKGTALKADSKTPETAPFLADTRYLLVAVVAPAGAPLFRWQMADHRATSPPSAPRWNNGARRPRLPSTACCRAAASNCCCRKPITWPAAKRTS
jgi:hypothetical protein